MTTPPPSRPEPAIRGRLETWFGRLVKDRRSGVSGRVIGYVVWAEQSSMLVVQPPVRDDRTVPGTVYVPEPAAELIPDVLQPPEIH